jgi:tRNA dimethylallyltransferase
VLYSRVEIRCEEMIEQGFIEEVELLEKLGIRNNYSASQAIGYKQCLHYLQTHRTKKDLDEFVDSFKKATRHYIKRQFTWFRKEPNFRWLNLYEIDLDRAIEYILQDYEQGK